MTFTVNKMNAGLMLLLSIMLALAHRSGAFWLTDSTLFQVPQTFLPKEELESAAGSARQPVSSDQSRETTLASNQEAPIVKSADQQAQAAARQGSLAAKDQPISTSSFEPTKNTSTTSCSCTADWLESEGSRLFAKWSSSEQFGAQLRRVLADRARGLGPAEWAQLGSPNATDRQPAGQLAARAQQIGTTARNWPLTTAAQSPSQSQPQSQSQAQSQSQSQARWLVARGKWAHKRASEFQQQQRNGSQESARPSAAQQSTGLQRPKQKQSPAWGQASRESQAGAKSEAASCSPLVSVRDRNELFELDADGATNGGESSQWSGGQQSSANRLGAGGKQSPPETPQRARARLVFVELEQMLVLETKAGWRPLQLMSPLRDFRQSMAKFKLNEGDNSLAVGVGELELGARRRAKGGRDGQTNAPEAIMGAPSGKSDIIDEPVRMQNSLQWVSAGGARGASFGGSPAAQEPPRVPMLRPSVGEPDREDIDEREDDEDENEDENEAEDEDEEDEDEDEDEDKEEPGQDEQSAGGLPAAAHKPPALRRRPGKAQISGRSPVARPVQRDPELSEEPVAVAPSLPPPPQSGPRNDKLKLRLVALNEPFSGNVHGLRGANFECKRNAARSQVRGAFKALLATNYQTLNEIVRHANGAHNRYPIVNLRGETLSDSWSDLFRAPARLANPLSRIQSFDGRQIATDPNWPNKLIWLGTGNKLGARDSAQMQNCDSWHSDSLNKFGYAVPLHHHHHRSQVGSRSSSNEGHHGRKQHSRPARDHQTNGTTDVFDNIDKFPCRMPLIVLCVETVAQAVDYI